MAEEKAAVLEEENAKLLTDLEQKEAFLREKPAPSLTSEGILAWIIDEYRS